MTSGAERYSRYLSTSETFCGLFEVMNFCEGTRRRTGKDAISMIILINIALIMCNREVDGMVSAVEDRYAKLFKIFHKQENFTAG